MTSKTSFFNKGIYKSTVKRYSWGAILYFVILFVSTGLAAFLNTDREYQYLSVDHFQEYPLILSGASITVPMLLALFVPTVAALLIFRFIHSKKQSIFTHSIPVCRRANFISSIAAAFTLMLVPILINGIILMLMSLSGFGAYFTIADCMKWIGYNVYGIFLMFSVAVISCCLTGNSFAAVAINALIHSFLFLTVASVSIIAETFVYGYTEATMWFEELATNNFFVIVFSFSDRYFRRNLEVFDMIIWGVCALAMYMSAYFLYKKRRLETATDVAGYKCLNHIFKYLITFLASVFVFAVLVSYIDENPFVFALVILIVSAIAYAACEMLLKKTVNVLYSWKGYAAYAVLFAGFIAVFAFTSFFGYETNIPDKADISEAAVYHYYYQGEEPFTANGEIIDLVLDTHESITKKGKIPVFNNSDRTYSTRIHIKYKLKDGSEVYRVYYVGADKCIEIMNKFFEYDDYKKEYESIFIDDNAITGVHIDGKSGDRELGEYNELINVIREDVLDMSYSDIHATQLPFDGRDIVDIESYTNSFIMYNVIVDYKREDTERSPNGERAYISSMHFEITDKYTRTVKWLEENGYESYQYEE